MSIIIYCLKYLLLNVISQLIPHPKMRAYYFRILGAKIGKRVRIERIYFVQVQSKISNLICGDDVFIGTGVTLDISSKIFLEEHAIIATGCSILTHQDFGDFNGNIMSSIYETKYCDVHLFQNVVVGADSTILAGVSIGPCSVIGAKSLVNCDIPEKVLAFGIPAKVYRNHGC